MDVTDLILMAGAGLLGYAVLKTKPLVTAAAITPAPALVSGMATQAPVAQMNNLTPAQIEAIAKEAAQNAVAETPIPASTGGQYGGPMPQIIRGGDGLSGSAWTVQQANQFANWLGGIQTAGNPHITGVLNVSGWDTLGRKFPNIEL